MLNYAKIFIYISRQRKKQCSLKINLFIQILTGSNKYSFAVLALLVSSFKYCLQSNPILSMTTKIKNEKSLASEF